MKIPLSLSVYEHAARIIQRTPWEVSRNAELLFEAQQAAYELYHHTPVVVGMDIYNLEAEAYGCAVSKPVGNVVPSLHGPIFASIEEALGVGPLDPWHHGRMAMVLSVAQKLKQAHPEADVRVPIGGPFSVAQSLLGLEELIVSALTDPEKTPAFLLKLVIGQLRFAEAIKAVGVDVALFESAAAPPLLSPDQFRDVELPALMSVMKGVAEIVGHPVPCIIGGDTLSLIPHMLQTGTDFLICPAETDRVAFLQAMAGHPEVNVRVNLNPAVYTRGSREQIMAEVDAVVALAAGRRNVLLGTGCIPYETDPANILFLQKYAAGG